MVQVVSCRSNKGSSYNSIAPRRTAMKKFNSQENILSNLPTLGLTLRKTSSFVNLIEESLSKQEAKSVNDSSEEQPKAKGRSYNDRSKASNFPAKMIKIGSWQVVSLNESQLVAKCYYAKKKLIWEVMEDGLKCKMEIQWSDISAIRATTAKDEDGILELELSTPPTFSREHIPQAGKHSSWYTCHDFTGGQASTYRIHYLQFSPGLLDKPYQTLLYHDLEIFEMSHKPFPCSNNPFFIWSPSNYMHCMAPTQTQLNKQFSITNFPRDMTMSNQISNIETTMQNVYHGTYSCQMSGNDLAFGEQVMNQVPRKPVKVNLWNPDTNHFPQVKPTKDSSSQYFLDSLANILNVNDYMEPNDLDVENLSESQKEFVQNFLSIFKEDHHESNKETLAPISSQVNLNDKQSCQQLAPAKPIQFFDNPCLVMNQHKYHLANAPPYHSLPIGLNNYPHNMVCNQMDSWNEV